MKKKKARRFSDKEMLDWMEQEGVMVTSPSVGWWTVFAKVCGMGKGETFREAIGAAMGAER